MSKTNSQRIVWSRAHDTLAVFVLDDFENRLESSNNHVPHWETNGGFFCANSVVIFEAEDAGLRGTDPFRNCDPHCMPYYEGDFVGGTLNNG